MPKYFWSGGRRYTVRPLAAALYGRGRAYSTKKKTPRAKPKVQKVDELLHDFGKDKSPTARSGGQANVRTTTEMKCCTEITGVAVTDGAFTPLAVVQLNSAYEPVDTEAEQPRGFDQYAMFYKRFRVHSCGIQALIHLLGGTTLTTCKSWVVGVTATMSGEAPTSLREALENPRTVYKYVKPYPEVGDAKASAQATIEAAFDCAEVFGNGRNYMTLDDVVGYNNANPSVILIATFWAVPVNGTSDDDATANILVCTNQKLTWYGPEKLGVS